MELAVVVDCSNLDRSAAFWCAVLGYREEPNTGDRYRSLIPIGQNGVEILLQRVPEGKIGKNRLHLDLRVRDLSAEVARAEELGARRITTAPIEEDGWRWHVLADPDGNEFCVLQGP
ncbi:VOC family protein [Actinoplanes sp. NPDC023714]|uniref:VOC family protein n=1 Tax=Actinoplanes sp. NPDC023714 TaxID=3154322 RepID=UPI003411A6C6